MPWSVSRRMVAEANRSGKAFARPFVKYTPTWPRSFMPSSQDIRSQVAKMKQIPDLPVAVAHELHVHTLVVGVGVAVVGPEEGADAHLLPRRGQLLPALGAHPDDLPGAQLVDALQPGHPQPGGQDEADPRARAH